METRAHTVAKYLKCHLIISQFFPLHACAACDSPSFNDAQMNTQSDALDSSTIFGAI